MDNDFWLKKQLASAYKNIRFRLSYFDKNIKDKEEGNQFIYNLLQTDKPFAIGRLGATESRCVTKWMNGEQFDETNLESIKKLSGVYPNDITSIKEFCKVYTDSLATLDVLTVWGVTGERKIFDKYCNNPDLLGILSLEPYLYSDPWSKALEGKKLLIVHPFTKTIEKQIQIKDKLFANKCVLPAFSKVEYVKAVQSLGGNPDYDSWFSALEYMKNEIASKDFDIAIIGAGAYALPLTAFAKSIGKQAIQLAGATQLLFGIKGKRWERRSEYKAIFNPYWVYPSENETPINKENVEGGSYWK